MLDGYTRSLESDRRHLLSRYRLVDVARKVVGVGSVGTRCWIVLLLGRDDDDPLLLQAKEAQESVLAPYTDGVEPDHQGRAGRGGPAADPDDQRHPARLDPRHRSRRQAPRLLRTAAARLEGHRPARHHGPRSAAQFARLCGASLARAHARSGDPVAIAAYLGRGDRFDRALAAFAQDYADRNERDVAALGEAVRSGRVRAEGHP